jgi:hypothetical protein
VTVENGKIKRTPGPTHEEFSPSNRNHWIPALALHGVQVENTQASTLRQADAPECKVLLRYADIKSRLNAIDGITRSLFTDGRVRAAGWNQLAARTGRIISTKPNLQQVPRDWRTGFRVDPPSSGSRRSLPDRGGDHRRSHRRPKPDRDAQGKDVYWKLPRESLV